METNLARKLDEYQTEVIGGKVVMMASPSLNHVLIAGNIHRVFSEYLDGKPCTPIPDTGALFLSEKEQYRPDMMVVCDPEKLKPDGVHGAPDLVVEVLSPGTGRNDKGRKKDAYERYGVREYWIVSPGDKSIEQYVLENGRFVLRDMYHKYPEYMLSNMDEAEKAAIVTEFHCTLFDDLSIRVEDVFKRMIPD